MFKFFLPASKVQKDRRIMRETDSRMAKYSRRGLIFNFFAFLACFTHGRFIEENLTLMIALTVGLLLITLLRGFYLFRFDSLYPRAPSKWRNSYFVATLIGAIWWGVILVNVTLKLNLEGEAPLLWIYTVIFFSSTAHAFAPYQKFLSYYQFFGLVPAAAAALTLGELNAYIYGIMMFTFYMVLTHQCRLISENYWERLEATYALARKTLSMEEEKRDTKANVKLNQEFMQQLHGDIDRFLGAISSAKSLGDKSFKKRINNELQGLHKNVCDFNGVLNKELILEQRVFNIRHEIQHLVAEFIDDAEIKNIQIETSLSPNLPMRLIGDASRLAQVIRTLLNIMLEDIEKCIVLVEVEFMREYETAGELYVSISRCFDKNKKLFFGDSQKEALPGTLGLVVSKGLADLMNGSLELNESLEDEQQFRFNAKLEIAEHIGTFDFHKGFFKGKNVLLVHNHPRIVDIKRQELDSLGFNVFTETQYKKAGQTLQNSFKFQSPIESLVFYVEPDIESTVEFCESLLETSDLKYTKKVGAATRRQQESLRRHGFDESKGFYYVDKPMGLFEIESVFYQIYQQVEEADAQSELTDIDASLKIALISDRKTPDVTLDAQSEWLGENLVRIDPSEDMQESIVQGEFVLSLIDCDSEMDIASVIEKLRHIETASATENLMPIVGISSVREAFEDSAYELGLDDYVDLTYNPKKTLKSTITYWSTLV